MVEIYKSHPLIITCSNTWSKLSIRRSVCMMTFVCCIMYVIHAMYTDTTSRDLIIPLTNRKFQTNENILNDNVISENVTSGFATEFSRYTTTTDKIAEIQYNLTESTQITKLSNDKLESYTKENSFRNVIKSQRGNFTTISLKGRLGNVLFQLAALISCAKRLNTTVCIKVNELNSSYFRVLRTSNINVTNVKTFQEQMYGKYENNIEHLDTSMNWTLSGYFQSWKYFYKDEDLIRRSFEFSPNIQEPAAQFVESFILKYKTIVGVHVRRGDMVTDNLQTVGYATAPPSYLLKSMNYFREKYTNIYFIIVSDDISWCKENIKRNDDTEFSKFDNPWIDMAILSNCDHVIITSGTFGWWGAWLAGGDVVYFKGYPRPGSSIDKGMCREDYNPPQWIGME